MNADQNPEVLLSTTGGVAIIELNRPPMNAFDNHLRDALIAATRDVADNPALRACVIHGGDQNFAAGADIHALATMGYEDVIAWNARLHATFDAIAALPIPAVAAINGYALGGGLELALAADIRVGSTTCTVGLPEVKLGILPGSGGTQRLTQIVGRSTAKLLLMSGRHLGAGEAHQLGILDEVVAADQTIDRAHELAQQFAAGPRFAIQSIKACVDAAMPESSAGHALERACLAGMFATSDRASAMQAFLERGRHTSRPTGPRT